MTDLERSSADSRGSPRPAADGERGAVANVLSFDLEHWYTATLIRDAVDDPVDRLEDSVRIVRDLLDAHDVRATFFVVGEVALEYPELIAALADDGHEIASHGHTHTPLFELTPEEFEAELADSAAAIEDAVGSPPKGFRAPNFSITPKTAWAFDVLERSGLEYDSSVFPVRTPMYGVSGAPIRPYHVDVDDPFSEGVDEGLLEFPLAAFHPTARVPIAGGFYARIMPERFISKGISNLNKCEVPAILYFHPWEFDLSITSTRLPLHKKFVSFYGMGALEQKLESLLATFDFDTLEKQLDVL
ncbi:polysaccharide deacetylase family protein [Natrononativus amylolyticus]|uniref:polysaccharide deacetylase family protein n=1 Tax=Natrononativus amylolyticus TaxID=2963434 RepID=UPI0020CB8965|nr:polysaccharide deacetylase family protein [Natrononativus amylolyticus]